MVSTFAGTANPGADGTGAAARFNKPGGVVSDGLNLYVADTVNHTIRKIVIATGAVNTLVGRVGVAGAFDGFGTSATFNSPTGITIDSTHTYLYVADTGNNKIRRVMISSGAVTSFTGAPDVAGAVGAADGVALGASFNQPHGITTDGTNLFVADTGNNKIRQIVIATGTVSSLTGAVGVTVTAGFADGTAFSASFNSPNGITIMGANLYVADTGNNKIRQVSTFNGATSSLTGASGVTSTAGAADGLAASAAFAAPSGITTDGTNLYVADANNNKIRKIVGGTVSSFTGGANSPGTVGIADGTTSAATFSAPQGIIAVGGNLYVADTNNSTIRAIVGVTVSTLAGNANLGADGTGAAASFFVPGGIVSDGINLYVTDANNFTIRKIVIATGAVTTLAGQMGVRGVADGTGLAASFNWPTGITTDGTSLYVADALNNKIRKITPFSGSLSAMTSANAVVTSFTGAPNTVGPASAMDGLAASAAFSLPYGITTDGVNLFVADMANNKIRQIVISSGTVSSLTGASGAVVAGAMDGSAVSASFNYPAVIAIDNAKANLYISDSHNHKIRQVVIATGAVTSVTGVANTMSASGVADGTASTASFFSPLGIATDGVNLYVADNGNYKIRQIVIATGAVSSYTGVANTKGTIGHADGTPSAATFFGPAGIAIVGTAFYITDSGNNIIRKIQ